MKPKKTQKENENEVDGRDLFQTPNYATDIIVPFLKILAWKPPYHRFRIWECACGEGKIVNRLKEHNLNVFGTDLRDSQKTNFLLDNPPDSPDCIVTNPPFSLKRKFYEKCLEYKVPFALLIPADYSGWVIKAVQDGAEKIIPTRRIDYITPNILQNIHEGEVWKLYTYSGTLQTFKKENEHTWYQMLNDNVGYCFYENISDVPVDLLAEYSKSQFHSLWLTWGFGLGKSETFVELTNEMKRNI